MRRFDFKNKTITLFISQEILNEFDCKDFCSQMTPAEYFLETEINSFLFDHLSSEFWTYIKIFAQKKKLPPIAVLAAHGSQKNGEWLFMDGKKEINVQKWLDALDGKFASLACYVCNPEAAIVHTRNSLLLLPEGEVSNGCIMMDRCHFSLIHPWRGEIDRYIINYETECLKKIKR